VEGSRKLLGRKRASKEDMVVVVDTAVEKFPSFSGANFRTRIHGKDVRLDNWGEGKCTG
jgi:hypothetical protein